MKTKSEAREELKRLEAKLKAHESEAEKVNDLCERQRAEIARLENRLELIETFFKNEEKIYIEENGNVFGDETGRLVAKFSHYAEAMGYAKIRNELLNKEGA